MRRTRSISTEAGAAGRRLAALGVLLLAAACAGGGAVETASPSGAVGRAGDAAAAIEARLRADAEAWNAGDLDRFLASYAEDVTFVGGTGLIRGLAALRARYAGSYWADGPPQLLSFRDIEVRPLGGAHALALGRYVLRERDTGAEAGTGRFSLVWARTADGWRIIHDHSSADDGE